MVNLFTDSRIYRHFKGGLYRILCEAKDSETKANMIVYQSIETGQIWTRSAYQFHKNHVDGSRRFTPIDNPVVKDSQDASESEENAGPG